MRQHSKKLTLCLLIHTEVSACGTSCGHFWDKYGARMCLFNVHIKKNEERTPGKTEHMKINRFKGGKNRFGTIDTTMLSYCRNIFWFKRFFRKYLCGLSLIDGFLMSLESIARKSQFITNCLFSTVWYIPLNITHWNKWFFSQEVTSLFYVFAQCGMTGAR
jgi:hypothetical protein